MEVIQYCEKCKKSWLILPTKKQKKLMENYEVDTLMEVIICEICQKEIKHV